MTQNESEYYEVKCTPNMFYQLAKVPILIPFRYTCSLFELPAIFATCTRNETNSFEQLQGQSYPLYVFRVSLTPTFNSASHYD